MNASYKEMATRIVNAENKFAQVIMDISGCTEAMGHKVRELYTSYKLIKIDVGVGQMTVKHGEYLEAYVVENAIKEIEKA